MEKEILHDKEKQKFFMIIKDEESYLRYRMVDDKRIHFLTTFVPPSQRGKGIAQKVVEAGLNFARENQYVVSTSCWYVEDFLERSDKYKDLAG
jgi:uncharacterized protein